MPVDEHGKPLGETFGKHSDILAWKAQLDTNGITSPIIDLTNKNITEPSMGFCPYTFNLFDCPNSVDPNANPHLIIRGRVNNLLYSPILDRYHPKPRFFLVMEQKRSLKPWLSSFFATVFAFVTVLVGY